MKRERYIDIALLLYTGYLRNELRGFVQRTDNNLDNTVLNIADSVVSALKHHYLQTPTPTARPDA